MELVRVYSASSELDAELIKSVLGDEGIPAMISSESYGWLIGGMFGTPIVGEVRVLVRPDDAEKASRVIAEIRFGMEDTGHGIEGFE